MYIYIYNYFKSEIYIFIKLLKYLYILLNYILIIYIIKKNYMYPLMLLKRGFTCNRLCPLTAAVQHFEIFLQFPHL